jgi:hypothetical protein
VTGEQYGVWECPQASTRGQRHERAGGMPMHRIQGCGSGTAECMDGGLLIRWEVEGCWKCMEDLQQVSWLWRAPDSDPCSARASSVHPTCGGEPFLTGSGLLQSAAAGEGTPHPAPDPIHVGTPSNSLQRFVVIVVVVVGALHGLSVCSDRH